MPLPGKVERPQRVTRSRRIKAESNAADRQSSSEAHSEQSWRDDKRGGLRRAVLKLDTEGDGAARRADVSRTVDPRGIDSFCFLKGGDASPWTTDRVVCSTIGSRRAALFRRVRSFGAANHKVLGGYVP